MAQKTTAATTDSILNTANIEAARRDHDDPDHPDALSVEEYRELLDEIQATAEVTLVDWLDIALREDHAEIVGETDRAYYIADHGGHEWSETVNQLDIEDEEGIVAEVLQSVHHKQAMDDGFAAIGSSGDGYVDLGYCDVHVIAKPLQWRYAASHESNELESLVSGGLSSAEALDYWMVERKGRTPAEWAEARGVTRQAVSENVNKALRKRRD